MNGERERNIILASQSPRRNQLLRGLGFLPRVHPARIDEVRGSHEAPDVYTRRLCREKAESVAQLAELRGDSSLSPWVVAADTVVVLDGEVLEKPATPEEACHMLGRLSGRWHAVITSFSVCRLGESLCAATRTVEPEVLFKSLSAQEIERYVATGEPLDKAGAYGIQEVGSYLVREVRGSYFAVVGLPVCELVETLVSLGAVSRFPFTPVAQAVGAP